MSYEKQPQPQLNGAYYGPPIPPPGRDYNRPRGRRSSGRGCGCCLLDCLCDCGCCLFGCFFKIIFSILIFIGLIILVFWLIVRPHEVKFHAVEANLTTFNLTNNNNNLNYDLAVNFTVRNPNRHIGVYYDKIDATAIYAGQRLRTQENAAERFYQGHKNTSSFGPVVLRGQSMALLGGDARDDYEKQTNDGVYEIEVRLNLRVRFKLGLFKTGTWKPKIKCDLKVPLTGNSSSSSQKFETTRCGYDL